MRQLRHDLGTGGYDSPAELYHALGMLSLLANDLSELLPALRDRLENGVLDGRVRHVGDGDAPQETYEAIATAGHSIALAHFTALLIGQELENAQTAVRDLASA